jgi:hypothetical protein
VRAAVPWVITAVALMSAVFLARSVSRRAADRGVLRYEVTLPAGTTLLAGSGSGNAIAISRDGRFVAFAARTGDGRRRLFIRAAEDLQAREVPGGVDATYPAFSPDGAWLAFWSGGQLLKVPVRGGAAVLLADVPVNRGTAWPTSDEIVISIGAELARIPAGGGKLTTLSRVDSSTGETAQFNPVALADGKSLLYTSLTMGGPPSATPSSPPTARSSTSAACSSDS